MHQTLLFHLPALWSPLPGPAVLCGLSWGWCSPETSRAAFRQLLLPPQDPPSAREAENGATMQMFSAVSLLASNLVQLQGVQETKAAGDETSHISSMCGSWVYFGLDLA